MPHNRKRHAKYLLVNDDRLVCLVTGQLIRSFDSDISIAIKYDGKSAIFYLIQMLTDDTMNTPDVVFLDMEMDVMDGVAFLKAFGRMRALVEKTSVYILTATIDSAKMELMEKYPYVKGMFELPLTLQQLKTVVNK